MGLGLIENGSLVLPVSVMGKLIPAKYPQSLPRASNPSTNSSKQVTLFSHVFLLVMSSPFTRPFSSAHCLGDKSAISSLPYSVKNQNSGPPLQ